MTLWEYATDLIRNANQQIASGEIFAKILTPNDNASKHGVHIPYDAYSFFPTFIVADPSQNQTLEFCAFSQNLAQVRPLSYKYYERYPERRITRLASLLNNTLQSPRLLVFVRAKLADGSTAYSFECLNSSQQDRVGELYGLIFGNEVQPTAGQFIVRPIVSPAFAADEPLTDLLGRFDAVKSRGWIDTLRSGDTGVGYTFETLIGVEENNDQIADFRGIELKCKGKKEGAPLGTTGKINLFQAGPTWAQRMPTADRIRILGTRGEDGLYSCFSQVTTNPNNLNLLLNILDDEQQVRLEKQEHEIGHWTLDRLEHRLQEKHARAAFIKARHQVHDNRVQYRYEELVYCERPSIDRFVQLVERHNIVFEFLMSEKTPRKVRNHGYPWRLVRSDLLDQLFAFQIKLR